MKPIGYVRSDFTEKFGIPRQAGVVDTLRASIVFEPEYRNPDAFRFLEEFSHIWVLWEFSKAKKQSTSLTVRPPRLGGNRRVGVFATRSPFRPNPIGLSCVRLDRVELTKELGVVLHISGADMLSGTPVYDIKPYLPYTDCHPEAVGGFTEGLSDANLDVQMCDISFEIQEETLHNLLQVLRHDPRPSYQNEPDRIYGMEFAGLNVKFTIDGKLLKVLSIEKL